MAVRSVLPAAGSSRRHMERHVARQPSPTGCTGKSFFDYSGPGRNREVNEKCFKLHIRDAERISLFIFHLFCSKIASVHPFELQVSTCSTQAQYRGKAKPVYIVNVSLNMVRIHEGTSCWDEEFRKLRRGDEDYCVFDDGEENSCTRWMVKQ